MDLFQGFVVLEDTLVAAVLVLGASDVPTNADALPTWRCYGPDGFLLSGTCAFLDSGSITGATNANPIVITSTAHGLTTGTRVTITGVGGNTAANTTAIATYVTDDTFSIPVAGNGAYTSGGTFNVTGAYSISVAATAANGFAAGQNYNVLVTCAVSSTQKGLNSSFMVA